MNILGLILESQLENRWKIISDARYKKEVKNKTHLQNIGAHATELIQYVFLFV